MSEYQKGRERGYELGKLAASDTVQAMADTIEALRAENARLLDCYKGSTYTVDVLIKDNAKLREALEPFAALLADDDDSYIVATPSLADIRAARAAMGGDYE